MLGKRVQVTGCGPIGTLSILAARRAGAAEIVATDLQPAALAYATAAGADRTIDLSAAPEALGPYATATGHFDVLLECSGAAAALAAGIAVLRPRGVVVQIGHGGDMNVPMQAVTTRELELRGSFRFHEEFPVAVQMMRAGLIDVTPLISHSFALDDFRAAFDLAADRSRSMKAQIAFS
jgi:L-idonate 5-dehydrogenase